MTGLERNGDVVQMASYAPLMAHVDAWQWTPDAIWFDNLRSYGTPDYYVQKLFANNTGTRVIPANPQADAGLYTSASLDEKKNELIVKVINDTASIRKSEVRRGTAHYAGAARVTTLQSDDLNAENTFDHPKAVSPHASTAEVRSGMISADLGAYSVNVYRIMLK